MSILRRRLLIFCPILIGIEKFEEFQFFNRWGQLVFDTKMPNAGWDGLFDGRPQPSDTFVYHVSGQDYTGKEIDKKGTIVLIR